MAQLDKASFIAKFTAIFADNTTRDVSEADMRTFMQDIADSLFNILDDNDISRFQDSGATYTLTDPGRYVHRAIAASGGTGSTWGLPAGSSTIAGREYWIKNEGTGNIVLNNNGGTLQTTIFPNATRRLYWDDNGSKWIIQ